MTITNQPGDVLAGRHPDDGFVIVGEIGIAAADVLLRQGFRSAKDGALILSATLSKEEEGDLRAGVAALLTATRHNFVILEDGRAAELAVARRVYGTPSWAARMRDRVLALIRRPRADRT